MVRCVNKLPAGEIPAPSSGRLIIFYLQWRGVRSIGLICNHLRARLSRNFWVLARGACIITARLLYPLVPGQNKRRHCHSRRRDFLHTLFLWAHVRPGHPIVKTVRLGMDAWSLFRKFSSRVKRRSKTPAPVDHTPARAVVTEPVMAPINVPETQSILLLYGPREPYKLVEEYPVPELKSENEVLVKTSAIGLNPIDWKAPDYNFAIPQLPYISGRESSGDVCQVFNPSSRLKLGDRVRHPPVMLRSLYSHILTPM